MGKSVELSFLYHTKDDDEGSKLIAKYYLDGQVAKELEFGWTNRVLKSFIELLKQFPIEIYEGHFSHYEKHLELLWEREPSSDTYLLTFDLLTESDSQFSVTVDEKCIHDFGLALEVEMHNAPSIEEYFSSSNEKA
ncbi:hypothetical protein [uncultured Brevibacillus sp.]|uniref:hypothetical protein n=1 Tax=uncultured Brevibacillus sp. TaxID=169970 RepID=UPI002594C8AB|nr:hypothetical protein [uncultured Brevibacillus sp.]